MKLNKYVVDLFLMAAAGLSAQDAVPAIFQVHQTADQDGIYYTGPEVTTPTMVSTVSVPYPYNAEDKYLEGMTVMAMVIDAKGLPQHIQVLHSHGEAFDQASIGAVKHSKFAPGMLAGKPVPVWIDVRVVFYANRAQAVPQVLITERDWPAPAASKYEDKHGKLLSRTPPFLIHTVDADFADPFVKHPYVQVAVVDALVGVDGLPKDVHIRRGLGFGLDAKAVAAVQHYRFIPATKNGQPIEDRKDVMVNFATF
jgi:TonB family protein